MTKKLYMVSVELSADVPVLADSAEEAEAIARENATDDPQCDLRDRAMVSAGQPLTHCPRDCVGVIPWGSDEDDEVSMDKLLPLAPEPPPAYRGPR